MKFDADCVEYGSRDGVVSVFLGNARRELALTIAGVAGAAGHSLEWNEQGNTCANAVERAELRGDRLEIRLGAEAAGRLGVDEFDIACLCETEVLAEVAGRLKLLLGERFVASAAVAARKTAPKPDSAAVRYLNLEGQNLTVLPGYVAEMQRLETVKLAGNPALDFRAVCEVLGRCPVKQLSFTTDGPVPENIGGLSELESLTLDGFTRPLRLPESFGQLRKLSYLFLMGAGEVVLPDSVAELESLAELHMRVPSWHLPADFHRMAALRRLDFTGCRNARVPEGMAGMTAVDTVIFGDALPRDYAQILPVVARMPNVRSLELGGGVVPPEVGLCRQIEELVIWAGAEEEAPVGLPAELFALAQLKTLFLRMSRLKEIPEALGNLRALEDLVIRECECEELPETLGRLSRLRLLNLSENALLRQLPESLGDLGELRSLYLDDCPALTQLPASAGRLERLEQVRLSDPERVANVPAAWAKLLT